MFVFARAEKIRQRKNTPDVIVYRGKLVEKQ